MKKSGSRRRLWLATLLLVAAGNVFAAVTASVDRQTVALGDSLRLTITSDGSEDVSDLLMAPLLADFDILQRSTSSSMSIINGSRTHTRQLLIDIAPRRQGTLTIPALSLGSTTTRPITITVTPPPESGDTASDNPVVFEAELDRDTVYVQGQLLLTLRLQVAINLDSPSITELKLDNAFVKQLSQNSFQRTIDGRAWRVHEIRYAIFPEQSGVLEIPSQTFAARESVQRRSLFDRGGGRQLRRTTEALRIDVLPRPAGYPAGTWLPARDLQLEERWSTPPDRLRAGESTTRTVRIVGEGLQGAQLPPVLFPPVPGLKYYPDQPLIEDREGAAGLIGIREDSAALVATGPGTLRIPEIRIPWWDTASGELREAVLPAREIAVAAGDPRIGQSAPAPLTLPLPQQDTAAPGKVTSGQPGDVRLWQLLALGNGLGWLSTLAWLLWRRRTAPAPADSGGDNPSEARAWKSLLAACASGSPGPARQALVNWSAALFPGRTLYSLDQVQALFSDAELDAAVADLNRHLYSAGEQPWDGAEMAALLKRLRRKRRRQSAPQQRTLELYPGPA